MPGLSISVGRVNARLSVLVQRRAPLSTARVPDETEAQCGQGFAVRYRLWNGIV